MSAPSLPSLVGMTPAEQADYALLKGAGVIPESANTSSLDQASIDSMTAAEQADYAILQRAGFYGASARWSPATPAKGR